MPPVAQTGFCLERGGLNQKWMFFVRKLSNLGPVLNKPMQLKRVTEGAEPPAAGWFLAIFGKNSNFNAISITFRTF